MKLQFKHQAFQAEAAAAVCDVFSGQPLRASACLMEQGEAKGSIQTGLAGINGCFCNTPLLPGLANSRLLENLRTVQRRNGLKCSEELAGPGINLSIEMETGTGKTYTYVKTIYELNARYGWSKFIIVVPSVAIREGVFQSLQTTQEHFAEEYGKKLRFFVYSSERLTQVERFASDSAIHVMIINMQAFNSSKSRTIIDKRLDAFRSRRPIDLIAQTRPILIIDEPQSVEGKQTKESLKKFHPLFTLRYSATYKEAYNMVYRLDALDAYNQKLVKKIAALGITITGSAATDSYVYLESIHLYKDKAPTARLGFQIKGASGIRMVVRTVKGGDDLFVLSNGLEEYADRYIILPNGIDGRDNSITFLNGVKLSMGQIQGNVQMTQLQRRIQIRETIRTHLRREQELYAKGIKVLSLFFIDEVAKYRLYDNDKDDGHNGEYACMFEEEYENVVRELRPEIEEGDYRAYLDRISPSETHQGYFSIDKRRGKKGRFVESKLNRRSRISEDADAFDLIMKDKERLLSLNEPVRFLFSHSALREGWDNPNVFQICMLKHQSESEIRSRQEIGRGLRLCVNQQGERMDESMLGSQVQELNKLTLITDMSFRSFAQALQTGLAEDLADRPQKVDVQLFLGKTLTRINGKKVTVSKALAKTICEDLIAHGYMRQGELTEQYYRDKADGMFVTADEVKDCAASVVSILSSVFDRYSVAIEDAHGNNVTAKADLNKLGSLEFQRLWKKINRKSFYTVAFDSQELIQNSIEQLDQQLEVSRILLKKEYGEQNAQIEFKEQLLQGKGFQPCRTGQEPVTQSQATQLRYDLLGKLVEETGLTRATVAAILAGVADQTFSMFRLNPEEFIIQAGKIINDAKAEVVLKHIAYGKLDGVYDTDIFLSSAPHGRLGQNAMPVNRCIYDYLIYDSQKEYQFARQLEQNEAVVMYVKLPKAFFISTPVGRYSPDWAIIFREGAGKHIYFVAETKGSRDTMALRGVERAKIACAKAHFAAVSGGDVIYDVVTDMDQLLNMAL